MAIESKSALSTSVECNFFMTTPVSQYICGIHETSVDADSLNITITGQHLPGRNNNDVTRVQISNSSIPFVISELFITFPNLVEIHISTGLKQLNSFAFVAERLEVFSVTMSEELTEVDSGVFVGALSLRDLRLPVNSISRIHENAFLGLQRVTLLNLNDNKIQHLPLNVFRPLLRLQELILTANLLEVIDGRLFSSNNRLTSLAMPSNEIHAIDRNFMKSLPALRTLFLRANQCVSYFFVIGMTPNETFAEYLRPCFENFDAFSNVH